MFSTLIFIVVWVCMTLALLRTDRRWPQLLAQTSQVSLLLSALMFAALALEICLMRNAVPNSHLNPHLVTTVMTICYFVFPLLGGCFLILAGLTGVAMLCKFCLKFVHKKARGLDASRQA